VAPLSIEALAEEVRFVLGDTHYDDNDLREACLQDGRFLITPKRGAYPHADAGVEVRRIFRLLRHRTMENFNEHFKAIFDVRGPVLTKGKTNTEPASLWERCSSTNCRYRTATNKVCGPT
jgi:hypothetical protein